jgi:valyl-tRNA synthetase
VGDDSASIDPVIDTLQHVRRAKTEAKQSQKAAVTSLVVTAPASMHAAIEAGRADLSDAGSIESVIVETGDELRCAIALAPTV